MLKSQMKQLKPKFEINLSKLSAIKGKIILSFFNQLKFYSIKLIKNLIETKFAIYSDLHALN